MILEALIKIKLEKIFNQNTGIYFIFNNQLMNPEQYGI